MKLILPWYKTNTETVPPKKKRKRKNNKRKKKERKRKETRNYKPNQYPL